ncbi:MAG: hypothetical protein HXX09_16460 [Bacteroidetes bacterium]|nr:hypothetical protein [Bacteroidota bacterium]
MKKIFFLFIILFGSFQTYCQCDTGRFVHGINFSSYTALTEDYSYTYNLNYTLQKGRSIFSLGPSFGSTAHYSIYGGEPDRGSFNLIGFLGSYKFNILKPQKRVNVFFCYDIYYHFYKGNNRDVSNSFDIKVKERKFGFCIGNGISVRTIKQLYIETNIGMGYRLENFQVTVDPELPNNKETFDFNLIIKLGLGFKF